MGRNKIKVSIVIPAYNEEEGIGDCIKQIPTDTLEGLGYDTEVIVVDNNCTDRTPEIARAHGATVVFQPLRGYGNAYKAGFDNATGDIIATGDADMTYPFDHLPELLGLFRKGGYDFMNTDRLSAHNAHAMTKLHVFGNWVLSLVTKILFFWPFRDSQSGMWIFDRAIWKQLDVRSGGMPFSQELKIEAYAKGFKCVEVPIVYRVRAGEKKLSTFKDGWRNISQLFIKRITLRKQPIELVLDEVYE